MTIHQDIVWFNIPEAQEKRNGKEKKKRDEEVKEMKKVEQSNPPVNKSEPVNALNSHNQLCSIKSGHFFCHDFLKLAHESEKIASRIIFHYQIQQLLILKAIVKIRQPLLVCIQEDLSFFFEHGSLEEEKKGKRLGSNQLRRDEKEEGKKEEFMLETSCLRSISHLFKIFKAYTFPSNLPRTRWTCEKEREKERKEKGKEGKKLFLSHSEDQRRKDSTSPKAPLPITFKSSKSFLFNIKS
jgi:hypothetical protein